MIAQNLKEKSRGNQMLRESNAHNKERRGRERKKIKVWEPNPPP